MSRLKELEIICEKYINDSECVYKLCDKMCDKRTKWYLIVMRKSVTTQTNESRKNVVDSRYAKFRASELDVLFIINVNDFNDLPQDLINVRYNDTLYCVGKKVFPDEFNEDLNDICSNGIHYFKTLECAYDYNRTYPCDYIDPKNDTYVNWTDDGVLTSTSKMHDSERIERCSYYPKGQINTINIYNPNYSTKKGCDTADYERYENGKQKYSFVTWNRRHIAEKKTWYESGQLKEQFKCLEEKTLTRHRWHKNGTLEYFIIYQTTNNIGAAREIGIVTTYFDNGKKASEGLYKNGSLIGDLIRWNVDGTLVK